MVRQLVLLLFLCLAAGSASAGDEARFTIRGGGPMPMVGSDVRVAVRGPIAQVRHVQRFHNPSSGPIEAIYTFPLPADAAVGAMVMHLGERTITAKIERREVAAQQYAQAKREGKAAALLTQERPNIFTQSVHGILPGEAIDVELTYDVLLEPDSGWYELAIPTVVGPRYIPGAPTGGAPAGTGGASDTARVPDASRISPPIQAPGSAPRTSYAFALDLEAGLPLAAVDCPTHAILLDELGPTHVAARLAQPDTVADKDLVVRWRVSVKQPTVAILGASEGGAGHLAAIIEPPALDVGALPPRELVFVLDTSGSMSGEPLALVKQGIRYALDQLGPADRFRIINFSNDVTGFDSGASVAADQVNLRRARSWLNGLGAAGGTEMLGGIKAALSDPPRAPMERYVVFMTDGYIGNEQEILAAIGALRSSNTFLFSFGVGSSVNRYLIEAMARAGHGADEVLLLDDPAAPQVARFFARLRAPMWSQVSVSFDGLEVRDLTPSEPIDLFAGRPLVVTGRYSGSGVGTARIRATVGGRPVEVTQKVSLPAIGADAILFGRLWARSRLRQLGEAGLGTTEEATALALAHALVSPTTAFIAIDDRPRLAGPAGAANVPVELPEGVSAEGVGLTKGAPVIDAGATSQGITIDQDYTRNIPVPGRTFESTLGTAAGSQGDGDGVSFSGTTSLENEYSHDGIGHRDGSGRATAELAARVGLTDGELTPSGHLRLGLRLNGRFEPGVEVGLIGHRDGPTSLRFLATLSRWRLWRWLGLRLGLGLDGTLDATVHAAWSAELVAPLFTRGRLAPIVSVGVTDVLGDDDTAAPSVGVGLRF